MLIDESMSDEERVLLFIEKQAVVQVLIQQLAVYFDQRNPKRVQDVSASLLVCEYLPSN